MPANGKGDRGINYQLSVADRFLGNADKAVTIVGENSSGRLPTDSGRLMHAASQSCREGLNMIGGCGPGTSQARKGVVHVRPRFRMISCSNLVGGARTHPLIDLKPGGLNGR